MKNTQIGMQKRTLSSFAGSLLIYVKFPLLGELQ
jgi:hypothetical protein